MGTNYYTIPKLSDAQKEQVIEDVRNDRFTEALDKLPTPIHIGKSSAGWQFIFNHNDWKHFDKTLESLQNFIAQSEIEDEYGSPITSEEFWSMVQSKAHLLDNKEYYENWEKYNKDFITGEPLPKPAYTPKDYWQETHFGLFFSTSTDFC